MIIVGYEKSICCEFALKPSFISGENLIPSEIKMLLWTDHLLS